MKKFALISVTDKSGVVEFAQGLVALGYQILSTGGTAKALRGANVDLIEVSEWTGQPEILDGRVKTLQPKIHAGLLANFSLPEHEATMSEQGWDGIEVLAVNLYDFASTISKEHRFQDAIESIDIGGPAMIRAAAKNAERVFVVVDPADYAEVLAAIGQPKSAQLRAELMAKAFRHTAYYDSMIARYLSTSEYPEKISRGYVLKQELRYGENPHQSAAVYIDPLQNEGVAHAEVLWGKELSYNNYLDSEAAWELVSDLPHGSCAIIKHGNPCGAALGVDLVESFRWAKEADPISAFGGIAALAGTCDTDVAEALTEKGNFLEVVIAEEFSNEAMEVFKQKAGWGQSVRLLKANLSPPAPMHQWRALRGGVLVQLADEDPCQDWEVVTNRPPSDEEWNSLRLLWKVVAHVKSNAIVVGSGHRLHGVGAGQMNRVQSVRLALDQAGQNAKGAGLASDAFFPFDDSVRTAAEAGIKAIIQPGGSKKDQLSIDAANELGIAMVFTGVRHFRH